jgi:metallo-beta-lactamase family protein
VTGLADFGRIIGHGCLGGVWNAGSNAVQRRFMDEPYPHILHHGAVDGVTGSCHELVVDDNNSVLIDCGLFQGAEKSSRGAQAARLDIEFDIRRVRALLLTHCHVDHVGRIPYLLAAGFSGRIYVTEPSALLLPVVLEDALELGTALNQSQVRRILKLLDALIIPQAYDSWTAIALPGLGKEALRVRFRRAGHILGSAFIECHIHGESDGDRAVRGQARSEPSLRVVFSGDLGGPYTPLLPAPRSPYGTDILVLESTYGDRLHDDRKLRRARLQRLLVRCLRDRGALLIPAFSIGRTQELLYDLEHLIHRAGSEVLHPGFRWSDLEVLLDSPLAARMTELYRQMHRYWDREAQRRVAAGRHPLAFDQMTVIESHADHLKTVDALRQSPRPAVVIASSGMCTGGRIINYLKAMIENARTDILFVGYQAEGTPGRIIQEYGPQQGYVHLDETRYDIRAGVHTLGGYSAHADQRALVHFVKRMRRKPREVRLVHGDLPAKQALRTRLEEVCPGAQILIPSAYSASTAPPRGH